MESIFVLGVESIFGSNPSVKTVLLSDDTLMLSVDDGHSYSVVSLDVVAMTDLRDALTRAINARNKKTTVEQAAAAMGNITWDLPEPLR